MNNADPFELLRRAKEILGQTDAANIIVGQKVVIPAKLCIGTVLEVRPDGRLLCDYCYGPSSAYARAVVTVAEVVAVVCWKCGGPAVVPQSPDRTDKYLCRGCAAPMKAAKRRRKRPKGRPRVEPMLSKFYSMLAN